jgi:hypothetical protein
MKVNFFASAEPADDLDSGEPRAVACVPPYFSTSYSASASDTFPFTSTFPSVVSLSIFGLGVVGLPSAQKVGGSLAAGVADVYVTEANTLSNKKPHV